MRSGLVQLGAWTAATGAAVALSWLGVHAVLVDTVFEQPTAIQLPSVASSAPAGTPGPPASPSAPPASPSGSPPAAAPSPSPDPARTTGATATSRSTPTARKSSSPPSTVHSYPVLGGRVALDQRPTEAKLVSAVPDPGWSMQVWHGDQWMQVSFSKDDRASMVMVSWNGHEPDVQTFVVGN
ncbi:hypothetical protein [Kitasatospora phosalacinea]|uniref:hypothetical protein n=1 Tax=Kitasatospora phosalacinea TaxID=2065 RepID=UPI0005257688|nr:hypothetical protein [Kitasatospora phosalacinea]